jgi:hypothetical protein
VNINEFTFTPSGGKTMMEPEHNNYRDEVALRNAVERKARRSLSDAEWTVIAPDWSAPYDDDDVTALVNEVKCSIPPQSKRSPEDSAQLARRAQAERIALDARAMVEVFREEIFGHKHPPFPLDLAQAAQWIEDQAQMQEFKTKGFHIGVKVPGQLDYFQCLVFLRDYLSENLGGFTLEDRDGGSRNFQQALEKCDQILTLSCEQPILEYLGINPEGQISLKRVHAPNDTMLGQLRSRAEELSQATGWKQHSVVHHLLTGGITARHSIQVASSIRIGREYFGENHWMVLTISEPDSVTNQGIIAALQDARSSGAPPWRRRPLRRARPAARSERVAALVEQTPGMTWADRLEEWNRRNPDDRFRTADAIKKAYSRADRR